MSIYIDSDYKARFQSSIEEMFPGAPADFLNTLNDVLYKYLVEDEVDEETDLNPILIVRPLDPLALVNGAPGPGVNFGRVVAALNTVADNIENKNVCFVFSDFSALQQARIKLGNIMKPDNVSWAYTPSPIAIGMGVPAQHHCLETKVITHSYVGQPLIAEKYDFFQA